MARLKTPSFKLYKPIVTRASLIEHLRWALSLELATIPTYLTALYSIQDNSSAAFAPIKAVAIEEMLHLSLVGNLLVSIGGAPVFDDDTVPSYPTYIPHHAAGGPFIPLAPLSVGLVSDVFMAIEQPSDRRRPPPEGNNFETIGQFYAAIELGFETVHARLGDELFVDRGKRQLGVRDYFGAGGGRLFHVTGLAAAKLAIEQIVSQGEGATPQRTESSTGTPFGTRLGYGLRPDGTYGPILGVPVEPSHYERFREIGSGAIAVPSTYPMQANIKAAQIPDPSTSSLAQLFDQVYTLALRYIEVAYTGPDRKHLFLSGAVPLMHTVMPQLAQLLMSTPLDPRTGSLGPNAGPGFELVPGPLSPASVAEHDRTLSSTPPQDIGDAASQTWTATLAGLEPFLSALPAL